MIDFDVRFVGMERLLAQNQSDLEIIWQNVGMQNEKGFDNENNYTTIAYKYPGRRIDRTTGHVQRGQERNDQQQVEVGGFQTAVLLIDPRFTERLPERDGRIYHVPAGRG